MTKSNTIRINPDHRAPAAQHVEAGDSARCCAALGVPNGDWGIRAC